MRSACPRYLNCAVEENLTLVRVVPIQCVQADDRQLVGYYIDRKVGASLEDMIILCRDEVAPDTVMTYQYKYAAAYDSKETHSVKLLVTAFGPATRIL